MTDLTGRTFGQLTVLTKAESVRGWERWVVRCICGTTRIVGAANLRNGNTKSCGCAERTGNGKGIARHLGVREAAAQRAERDSQRAVRDYLARRVAKREPMMGEGEWMS